MAKAFFDNFKEAGRIIPAATKNPYGEANLPLQNTRENVASWQDRVAIPFSYAKDNSGKRQYGTIFVPYYEASKVRNDGTVNGGEIEIYGAELSDGLSLNPKGFKKLFDQNKNNDFRIEQRAVNAINDVTADMKERGDTPQAAVKVDNNPFYKQLRQVLTTLQRGGGA